MNPIKANERGQATIDGVAFATRGGSWSVRLLDDRIESIQPSKSPAGWICIPPLADLHMHANRAFTLPNKRPDDFADAVQLTMQLFEGFDEASYAAQATKLFHRALHHGTTQIRTHADLDINIGLKAVNGTLKAKEAVGGKIDVDIVAFATALLDPAHTEAKSLIKDAIDCGCRYIGATPVLYSSPVKSIEALLGLAVEHQVQVDVHLDEHLSEEKLLADALAELTLAHRLEGRVTLSHGCALSILPPEKQSRVIDQLAQAKITVIALPLTNLFLQDRSKKIPMRRGLTPIKALRNANVKVLMATDNVCDAFYPFGDADILETLYVGMLASHCDDPEELLKFICNGRCEINVGDSADLVLIKGDSLDDILSRRPADRIIIKNGVSLASSKHE